jgi:hypothetical protein
LFTLKSPKAAAQRVYEYRRDRCEDWKIRNCLMQYDSWCESESTICRQTELEPALPYHFKLPIRLFYILKIHFTRFPSRLFSPNGNLREQHIFSSFSQGLNA